MKKNFLIFIGCIVILACTYRWGGVKLSAAKDLALESVYQGILTVLFPVGNIYNASAGQGVYEDIHGMFLPIMPEKDSVSIGSSSQPWNATDGIETGGDGDSGFETMSEIESTDTQLPAISTDILPDIRKQVVINRRKLQDFDYLRQNFYQIDNTTTIGSDLLSATELLSRDITLKRDVEGPQILIYHTHSQEAYADSAAGDVSTSIVAVGEYLATLLSEKYGIEVLHHKGQYDVEDHAKSYSAAKHAIEKILKEHPTIEVVIDLHRDGVAEDTHLVTEINGKPTAKIMFFNGLSRTTAQGNLNYLKNPYIEDNLSVSLQMQLAAEEYFPGFARKIYLKGYRYNMHLCPKSMLIEVGAQTNTFAEARNAMEPLAILLAKVLKTDKVP